MFLVYNRDHNGAAAESWYHVKHFSASPHPLFIRNWSIYAGQHNLIIGQRADLKTLLGYLQDKKFQTTYTTHQPAPRIIFIAGTDYFKQPPRGLLKRIGSFIDRQKMQRTKLISSWQALVSDATKAELEILRHLNWALRQKPAIIVLTQLATSLSPKIIAVVCQTLTSSCNQQGLTILSLEEETPQNWLTADQYLEIECNQLEIKQPPNSKPHANAN